MNKYRDSIRQIRRKLARQLRQGQQTLRVKGCHVHGLMTGIGGGHVATVVQNQQHTNRL